MAVLYSSWHGNGRDNLRANQEVALTGTQIEDRNAPFADGREHLSYIRDFHLFSLDKSLSFKSADEMNEASWSPPYE